MNEKENIFENWIMKLKRLLNWNAVYTKLWNKVILNISIIYILNTVNLYIFTKSKSKTQIVL